MPGAARFTRQSRLAEVGASGQARICAAHVSISSAGFAGEVEAKYLAAAGVGDVTPRAEQEPKSSHFPDEFASLDPAAREVAEGAYAALVSLRKVLEAS